MNKNKKIILLCLSWLIFLLVSFKFVFASSGEIDPNYKYAWGDTVGWVNFGCNRCNLNVYDDKITGYAWSANYGWINFNPSNGGVFNDGNGNLSGYAWGENLGWIDFSNVKINPSTGEFSGYSLILGGPGGRINFDCQNCKVKTSWRTSTASSSESSGDTILPPEWLSPPAPPEGNFRILINYGAQYTQNPNVILNLFGGLDVSKVAISNFSDFRDAGQESYSSTKEWNLCKGLENCPEEGKTYIVYVKFYAPWGLSSPVVSDSIVYQKKNDYEERKSLTTPSFKEIFSTIKEILPVGTTFMSQKKSQLSEEVSSLLLEEKTKTLDEDKETQLPVEERKTSATLKVGSQEKITKIIKAIFDYFKDKWNWFANQITREWILILIVGLLIIFLSIKFL